MVSRTYSGTTATLSYDNQDHFTEWNAGATSQEWYLYDAAGSRLLRRSTNGSTTSLTVYAFGREEHSYTSTGSNQGNTYYYTLAGLLLGKSDGGSTTFYQTDLLGSVVADLSNTAGSAALKGNEVYGPYGKQRYNQGTQGTPKGFTGQYNDALTGLDYYTTRYYDPVVGVFLSADSVQGNMAGMNPYAYVGGNPETSTDPTGQYYFSPAFLQANGLDGTPLAGRAPSGGWGHPVGGRGSGAVHRSVGHRSVPRVVHHASSHSSGGSFWDHVGGFAKGLLDVTTGIPSMINDVQTIFGTNAPWYQKLGAGADLLFNAGSDALMLTGVGELLKGGSILEHLGADELEHLGADALAECGVGLSFSAATLVATALGERAIGSLHPGDKVWAYNPKTHKMEQEPILHVWINHDHDLVDLTLTTTTKAQHGKATTKTSEVIHTNKRHPFLTRERGFLPVGQITLGMHVLRADGTYGVVTGWKVVSGTKVMYNLEVAQDHTFTVGTGEWVVHNASCMVKDLNPLHSPETSGRRPELENLSDQELLDSVNNPKNGDPIRINTKTGKVMDGNGRAYELLRRAVLPGSSITPDTPIYYDPYTPSSIP